MIRQRTWLALRLHRFELIAFGAAIVVLALALVMVSLRLDALTPDPACRVNDGSALSGDCERMNAAFFGVMGYGLGALSALVFVTFSIGVFLGVPIVAREVERGTARLAWSLAPSRWHWFLSNALPILAIVVMLTFIAGVSIDRFFVATTPDEDVANSFSAFGFRGVLIASWAGFIFGSSVAVGAVIGRALPAVIVAGLVVTIGVAGGSRLNQLILESEAIPVPEEQVRPGDLYVDQRFRLPDGTLVTWEYFGDSGGYDENGQPLYPIVILTVPGSQYRFAETREAVALGVGTLVALVIAGFAVARRRPG